MFIGNLTEWNRLGMEERISFCEKRGMRHVVVAQVSKQLLSYCKATHLTNATSSIKKEMTQMTTDNIIITHEYLSHGTDFIYLFVMLVIMASRSKRGSRSKQLRRIYVNMHCKLIYEYM